jgi:hypothetical protein
MTPDSPTARAGSRSTATGGTGAAVAGAQVGTGSARPGDPGASRFGLRVWRMAHSSHTSIDRPSRRPSASTTAAPARGVSTAMSTCGGTYGPTVLTRP